MALIKCPECGQNISDKASVCIHCGFPLGVISQADEKKNTQAFPMYLMDIADSYISIKCGKCNETTKYMKNSFIMSNNKASTKVPLTCTKCGNHIDKDTVIEKQIKDFSKESLAKCPKCGSTQIQVVARKWSITTGLLTNKVDRVCVRCKHKF